MSVRLLSRHSARGLGVGQPVIHTAIDDLESFFWILVWVIVHVLKGNATATGNNPSITNLFRIFSYDMSSQVAKGGEMQLWQDVVFGELFREWSHIFQNANQKVVSYARAAASARPGRERDESCDKLESYSKTVYNDVLESGFRHLEQIRRFSTWDEVVSANAEMVY
jgi:hypothetical protein